ncbi:MAG: hypothetical protein R2716_11335 [Microthrixaceae bacterium]
MAHGAAAPGGRRPLLVVLGVLALVGTAVVLVVSLRDPGPGEGPSEAPATSVPGR